MLKKFFDHFNREISPLWNAPRQCWLWYLRSLCVGGMAGATIGQYLNHDFSFAILTSLFSIMTLANFFYDDLCRDQAKELNAALASWGKALDEWKRASDSYFDLAKVVMKAGDDKLKSQLSALHSLHYPPTPTTSDN